LNGLNPAAECTGKISYVMPGIVHTFKKGHRIMVQIQRPGSLWSRGNPQKFVGITSWVRMQIFRKRLNGSYHSPQYPSRIVLPVWRR